MRIKKISKLNLVSIIAAATIVATPLSIMSVTNNNVNQKTVFDFSSKLSPKVAATDLNITSNWTESIFASTNGLYVFGDDDSLPKNRWLYQLNENGLQVNPSYPQYNKIQAYWPDENGTDQFAIPEFTLPQSGVSKYAKYANGEYTMTSVVDNYKMNFTVAGVAKNTLNTTNDFRASMSQPFFKFDLLRWEWEQKLQAADAFAAATKTNMQHMITTVNDYNTWDEEFATYQPYQLDYTNPTSETKTANNGYDFKLTNTINEIAVFNDYDLNGTYLNTYMYPNGATGIDSAFTINVDEQKLDKSLTPNGNDLSDLSQLVSLNLTNVPTNFLHSMQVEAVVKNENAAIEFNLYSKYIITNGEITLNPTPDIAVASFTSSGYLLTKTSIASVLNPPIISVDAFMEAVAPSGVVNRTELEKYVTLNNFPVDADITLEVTTPANILTGSIGIRITINKYEDMNGGIVESPAKFNTFLQLNARKTFLQTQKDNIEVPLAEVLTNLFDSTGIASPYFSDYFKFPIIPNGSVISLRSATVKIDQNNGLISFDVNASKYYDANAKENTNGTFSIKNFKAWAPATTVSYVSGAIIADRADEFIDRIADINGNLADRYLVDNFNGLKNYITINNVPETNVYIKKEPVVNKVTGDITFYILLDKANDGIGNVTTFESQELTLNLLPTPAQSDFALRNDYNNNITAEKFIQNLLPNNKLDTTYLKTFVNFIGDLPIDSVITIDPNYILENKIGKITFNILASKYYDENSALKENGSWEIMIDNFLPKYNPTVITLKAGYDKTLEPSAFIKYIMPDKVLDKDKLFEFIEINQDDAANIIEVEVDNNNTAISTEAAVVDLGLLLTNTYNSESILIPEKTLFSIPIPLAAKKQATTLTQLVNYNKNVNFAQFSASTLQNGKAVKAEIQKYVSIKNLPAANEIDMIIDEHNDTTGKVKFTLKGTGQNSLGNPQKFTKTFEIDILGSTDAGPQMPTETKITNLVMPNNGLYARDFINQVITDDTLNYALLAEYLDLSTMPYTANVSIKNNQLTMDEEQRNKVSFTLSYNERYSGLLANPIVGTYEYPVELIFPVKQAPTEIKSIETLPWDYTIDDLWLSITSKNVLDMNKLNSIVDLSSLPENTKVTAAYDDIYKDPETANIVLGLIVDKYYDEDGNLFEGGKKLNVSFHAIAQLNEQKLYDLLWLWVTLGLVGLAIIVSIILVIRRKKNANKFYDFKKDQY